MRTYTWSWTVLYLLTLRTLSVWTRCPGTQLSCPSRGAPSHVLCVERDALCRPDGLPSNLCQDDALTNITLQCSSNPLAFICDIGGESFHLEELCDGIAQCSDSSDEISVLCIREEASYSVDFYRQITVRNNPHNMSTLTFITSTVRNNPLMSTLTFITSTMRNNPQMSTLTFVMSTDTKSLLSSFIPSHTQSHTIRSISTADRSASKIVSVTVATPMIPLDHKPQNNFAKKDLIWIGSATSAAFLTIIIVFGVLVIIFCKKKRDKRVNAKQMDSFNINSKIDELIEDDKSVLKTNAVNTEAVLLSQEGCGTCNEVSSSPQVLRGCEGRLEIPFSALDLQERLGVGSFGAVYKAELRNLCYPHRQPKSCVAKFLKDTATRTEREAVFYQCNLMQSLEPHQHIVKMLGGCTTGEKFALIHEYCNLGNLRDFLIRNRKKYQQVSSSRRQSGATVATPSSIYSQTPVSSSFDIEEISLVEQAAIRVSELSNGWDYSRRVDRDDVEEDNAELALKTLLSFGRQITLGMEYLAQKKIVHRQLAARKVLVSPDWNLKIGDFGISKDVYKDLHHHTGRRKPLLRWMALETVQDGVFTTMSDIWSFGIVLWEIITLGSQPYPEFSNSEVIEKLMSGYRMSKPKNCPQYLYELMLSCWSEDPPSRPTFKTARQHIDQIITTTDEAEEYLLLVESQLSIS